MSDDENRFQFIAVLCLFMAIGCFFSFVKGCEYGAIEAEYKENVQYHAKGR